MARPLLEYYKIGPLKSSQSSSSSNGGNNFFFLVFLCFCAIISFSEENTRKDVLFCIPSVRTWLLPVMESRDINSSDNLSPEACWSLSLSFSLYIYASFFLNPTAFYIRHQGSSIMKHIVLADKCIAYTPLTLQYIIFF